MGLRMSPELNRQLCTAAARNNATWCDAMAHLHGAAGEFVAATWINRPPAPRFYPNLVTLEGPHGVRAHHAALAQLMQSPPAPEWAVKDSFAALDLDRMGFDLLFEARWIHRPAGAFGAAGAQRVTDEAMLEAWEQAWGGGASWEMGACFHRPCYESRTTPLSRQRRTARSSAAASQRDRMACSASQTCSHRQRTAAPYARRVLRQQRALRRTCRWLDTNTATASRA
jgi:hypothetical protein